MAGRSCGLPDAQGWCEMPPRLASMVRTMLCPFVKTAHVVHAHFKDVVARAAVESSDDIADGACILGRLTLLLAYTARMRRIADSGAAVGHPGSGRDAICAVGSARFSPGRGVGAHSARRIATSPRSLIA